MLIFFQGKVRIEYYYERLKKFHKYLESKNNYPIFAGITSGVSIINHKPYIIGNLMRKTRLCKSKGES